VTGARKCGRWPAASAGLGGGRRLGG
jgi:hypothetical protein